ncbi:MAG TPA: hypothetical protein VLG38_05320, partial [Gammaproteobacteria bacterium]|nr:hypothetical protein [Gammaproteobacteria bacterium]
MNLDTFYSMTVNNKELYAQASLTARQTFNNLRAGVEAAVQVDPVVLQNIDETPRKAAAKLWASV